MVQANWLSKSEHLATDRPFKNGTILNQNIKTIGIGMAFGFSSSVFEPPLYMTLIREIPNTTLAIRNPNNFQTTPNNCWAISYDFYSLARGIASTTINNSDNVPGRVAAAADEAAGVEVKPEKPVAVGVLEAAGVVAEVPNPNPVEVVVAAAIGAWAGAWAGVAAPPNAKPDVAGVVVEAAEESPPRPAKPDEAGAVAFGGGAVIPSLKQKTLKIKIVHKS